MSLPSETSELLADIREQMRYMQELGVEVIDAELSIEAPSAARSAERHLPSPAMTENLATPEPPARRAAGSLLASLPTLSGRPTAMPPKERREVRERTENTPGTEAQRAELAAIHAEIGPDCMRCKLSQLGRTKVVNSVGNAGASLMFVGEAPGADEDRLGEPFVGRAGQLLTDIIAAMGFERSEVFIGNINRCRPPGNRAPEIDECSTCKPFLLREIAVVRPRVIVVLGATAAHNLLETREAIGKLRGRFHEYMGVKVMPTYHPAYLLRDPHKKRHVWEDMKVVRDLLSN